MLAAGVMWLARPSTIAGARLVYPRELLVHDRIPIFSLGRDHDPPVASIGSPDEPRPAG
jgi:hypothetical protein